MRRVLLQAHRRERARVRVRGFTLIELLAVLAMIGVIVVAASPTFIRLLRDRRVNRAAMQITDYMRTARTMAIGRGQPMLVSWNKAGVLPQVFPGGTGSIELDEPVVTTSAAAQNCATTQWHTAASQVVNTFDIQDGKYAYTSVVFYDDAGTNPAYTEICFAASGRMYLRNGTAGSPGGAFHPVIGVPMFGVYNIDNDPSMANAAGARWVYVPPTGAARMRL